MIRNMKPKVGITKLDVARIDAEKRLKRLAEEESRNVEINTAQKRGVDQHELSMDSGSEIQRIVNTDRQSFDQKKR